MGSYTRPLKHSRMTSILPTPFYWDHIHHPINPLCSPQHLRLEGNHSPLFLLSWSPNSPFPPKRQHSSTEAQGDTSMDEDFPITSQEESSYPKKGRTADWLTCRKSDCADAFSLDSNCIKEARACYFTTHSWDWACSNTEDLSDIFKELA